MLESRRVTGALASNNRSVYSPFSISMGRNEVIDIYGIRVFFDNSGRASTGRLRWTLLQKSESRGEASSDTQNPQSRDDNDILMYGQFSLISTSAGGSDTVPYDQVWLPKPITVPRSPTFEIWSTVGATFVDNWTAELWYEKRRASDSELRRLLRRWIGRKQDVVSNVPRTIDE